MQKENFDFLITSDKNLQYQQNLAKYSIGFIILNIPDNNYETILPLMEKVKEILHSKERPKVITVNI